MTDIKMPTRKDFVNITGNRYGRLVVINFFNKRTGDFLWFCKCDCGHTKNVSGRLLKNGLAKSCGCLKKELLIQRNTTHGMSNTPEFDIWSSMKNRCLNPNDKSYKNYGGRGITVCKRWLESFDNFLEDIGKRPFRELTLERIDNEKGYEKSNCKWATRSEQRKNQRPKQAKGANFYNG